MKSNRNSNGKRGFTLIELLVVIAIISLLSGIVMASLNSARSKARDARRLSDMRQIQTALELYYDTYGAYPNGDNDGCGGWDIGNQTYPLLTSGGVSLLGSFMPNTPRDPTATTNCTGYGYYRYPAGYDAGQGACPAAKGNFYILWANMESTIQSPGFSCPGWGNAGASTSFVTGRYENP